MNPFITLLITLPLIATVLLMIGLLAMIVQGEWEGIILFIFFGGIAAYLVKLLQRTATVEGGTVELPVSPEIAESSRPFRKRMTIMVLLEVYGLAGFLVIALVGFESLRYWIGGICFILGILLLISGWQAKQSFQQASSGPESRATQIALLDQSLTTIRRSRNYVLVAYPLIALYLAWTYHASQGEGSFSLFDLVGVLFVLAASAFWFIARVQALGWQRESLS